MTNSTFFEEHRLPYVEIAICVEDVEIDPINGPFKGKFTVPVLTPFLGTGMNKYKDYNNYNKKNIENDNKGQLHISACTVTNYIELYLPNDERKAKAGDKFLLVFIGGDINNPYLIGRYKE